MKNSLTLSLLSKRLLRFFQHFHLTIFIVIIVGGLASAVLSLYHVLSDASDLPANTSLNTSTTFDQTTINRLNQMYTSGSAPSSIQLPTGRNNPFGE